MILHLIIGSSNGLYNRLMNKDFPPLLFASDNLETVAHYFEGEAIGIEIDCDPNNMMEYVSCETDIVDVVNGDEKYTWGYTDLKYPEFCNWYSFSGEYLKDHIKNIILIDNKLISPILMYYIDKEEE